MSRLAHRWITVPYRSDAHEASERELQKLHEEATGRPHQFLEEHIQRGLVNEEDLKAYLSHPDSRKSLRHSCFYTGHIEDAARPLRRALHYKRRGRLSYLIHLPALACARSSPGKRVKCYTAPSAQTNRLYALIGA